MYFKPQKGAVGDVIPFYHRGEYHLFYLVAQSEHSSYPKRLCTPWGHIVSKDLLQWRELPHAITPSGKDDSPDKYACWTGSVIAHEGAFHIFYTGVNFDNKTGKQTICHATSKDLNHWQKDPDNPILTADERWYDPNDWRDPFVYWYEKEKCFHMLITARKKVGWPQHQGCLAIATSKDFHTWEVRPPFWEPSIAHTLECPERFQIGSQEYLAFSTYSELNVTHYRLIEKTGEIVNPKLTDQIDGSFFYAAKGLSDEAQRIMFGWIPEVTGGSDEGKVMWGGNLGIPHTLKPQSDGNLAVYYPDSYRRLVGKSVELSQINKVGDWQIKTDEFYVNSRGDTAYTLFEQQPPEFYMTLTIELKNETHSAGLILNSIVDLGSGYYLEFENVGQSLLIFKYSYDNQQPKRKVLVQRTLPFPIVNVYVELFYCKGLLTVFVNKSVALSMRMYVTGPSFGFFVKSGQVRFRDFKVHTLECP